ncbi:HEAT repeat-containing protein 6 isoform X2 [Alosa sapidissima]|uniref:HEAT repeat-containing protein 6 isoform X2 n=1 Tax=Alosa sapidissima TaxID=34773 RepID=UPI001C08D493|nr:HEAT repeat-containing protein 6 isoform X2 [Alosa sapidissima]
MEHGSSADMLLRCYYDKLCSLTPLDCPSFKTELNLLLDELISENYSNNVTRDNIRSEDVCRLLLKASQLVPFSQEHLVLKLCQLVSQLFNQLQVSMDTQTLHCLVSYYIQALQTCSLWTHADILLALSSLLCGNGSSCQQHLSDLLGQKGILVICSAPNQADIELRSAAIHCMANLCLGTPGQPYLEEPYREICFRTFLQTLQSPKPPGAEDLVFCTLLQNSLKGMQCLLNGVKWKPGHGDDLGFLLAVLKKLMFYGLPGMVVEMPKILYPAPLPQYDVPFPKVSEETMPTKPGGNKKKKPRGNVQKAHIEGKWVLKEDSGEDQQELELRQGGGRNPKQMIGNWSQKPSHYQLSWRSSESEYSDTEGGINAKLRLYQMRVRQGSLHCFLSLVKCVDKRVLFGYWSAFIPDTPAIGGPPSLTFLTVVLKDPSPKVRAGSLQVLSSLLEGSRLFLSAAEDTSTPRQAFTSFSATLASSLRELHRSLLLALMAESSSQTLTQVIKCVAHLVCNTPYHRLRPGLLSPIWKQIQQYVHHRDVNVRVSSLTLLGALVSAQAPLPEIQQLLQQPAKTSGDVGFPHEAHMCQNWRQQRSLEEGHWLYGEEGICWLLRLCVCVVTQPREDHSDSGTIPFHLSPNLLEPSPVRLEALQVLAHLVKGYFFLTQEWLLELCQVSACCLREQDSSVQLHGTKLLEELGTSIIQQYRTEEKIQESTKHVPLCKDVMFMMDSASVILTALEDHSPNVRAKAAWSLGNLTDAIIVNRENVVIDFQKELTSGLLFKLVKSSIQAAKDKDRVKSNAVRALGNLLHLLQPQQLKQPGFEELLEQAMCVLVDTVQSDATMKVRWNACYALGNAFKNPALPLGTASWSAEAYSALSCVVVSCKNFKVRIKSAAALSIPSSRAKYGSSCQFAQIWIAITKALENSKDGVDFVEYRYHTSLCAQLCQTLLHLLNLCQPQDLGTIQSSVTGRFGSTLMGFLVNYLVDHESETEKEDKEERGKNSIQDRMNKMICVLGTLRKLSKEEDGCSAGADNIIDFLEGVVRSYKQTILQVSLSGHHSFQDQTNQTTEVSDAVQAKV